MTRQDCIGKDRKRTRKELVSWCFEPSQPLGVTSGLNEKGVETGNKERTGHQQTRHDWTAKEQGRRG